MPAKKTKQKTIVSPLEARHVAADQRLKAREARDAVGDEIMGHYAELRRLNAELRILNEAFLDADLECRKLAVMVPC